MKYIPITKGDLITYKNDKARKEFLLPETFPTITLGSETYENLLKSLKILNSGEILYGNGAFDKHWEIVFELELGSRTEYQRMKKLEMI